MSERDTKILLEEIINSIATVEKYTINLTFDEFKNDQKTRDAVLMQLMVLGETAARVPVNFRNVLPDIEWGRIIRSRNIIAHEYHGIDYEIIWKIIKVYLPPLKLSLESNLSKF